MEWPYNCLSVLWSLLTFCTVLYCKRYPITLDGHIMWKYELVLLKIYTIYNLHTKAQAVM